MNLFLACLAPVLGLAFVLWIDRKRPRAPFPVDEVELKRWASRSFPEQQCSVATVLARVLVRECDVPLGELTPEATFSELNVHDDFDGPHFVTCVEQELRCSIPESVRDGIRKFSDLVNYVSRLPTKT